jgi:predicted transcriptional regulator
MKCLTKGAATQNRIMTSTNLNVRITREYLRDLISSGFVQVVSKSKGQKVYFLTETGKEWLRIYKSLVALEKSRN